MRLLYACSELGLGHASRTIALGKRLEQRGHEVFFFTGGKAYEILSREFRHVIPVTPIAWYENSSGVITTASLINILFPLPVYDSEDGKLKIKTSSAMESIHRYYDLRKNIYKIVPDAIIADGDLNAIRMAQRWKIPDVYITNVIRPSYGFSSFLSPGERLTERYVRNCSKIIVPDNKPPYTICQYNIGDLESVGVEGKTEYVGSFFDTKPTEVSDNHIFAPVSGPAGTRAKMMNMLIPVFTELGAKSIISLGVPDKQKSARTGNCEIHSWLSKQERARAMQDASIVVFSGGHITCFETVKYTKPSICIPTQPEQLANAAKLQDMHCSIIAKNTLQLTMAINELEEKLDIYKTNMKTLNRVSNESNGLNRAVEIIENIKGQA